MTTKPQWSKKKPDKAGIWVASHDGKVTCSVFQLSEVPNSHWSNGSNSFYAFICDLPEIAPPEPELKPCKICGQKPEVDRHLDRGLYRYQCTGKGHDLFTYWGNNYEQAAAKWNEVNK